MNAYVRTVELFLFGQPQAGDRINNTIDDQTADKADSDTGHRADDLGHQADAAQATQSLLAEDAAGDGAERAMGRSVGVTTNKEDAWLGEDLYRQVMLEFLRRLEAKRIGLPV
mgnify:CR=1 FL=1